MAQQRNDEDHKTITESGESAQAEVMLRGPQWDDETLLDLKSFDEAVALAQAEFGGELVAAEETLGNGFTILNGEAKNILCGIPLLFLSWNFNVGEQTGEFVSAQVVGRIPGGGGIIKAIVNDGSTGIYKQLTAFTNRTGRLGGLSARGGLTRSDYTYTDPNTGESKPATTFYINTAAS